MDQPEIEDNTSASRFEVTVDGQLAQLGYRVDGDQLVLVHTKVPDELGGHGLGGRLVRAAVARASAEGLVVVPECPFARRWLEEHLDEAGDLSILW